MADRALAQARPGAALGRRPGLFGPGAADHRASSTPSTGTRGPGRSPPRIASWGTSSSGRSCCTSGSSCPTSSTACRPSWPRPTSSPRSPGTRTRTPTATPAWSLPRRCRRWTAAGCSSPSAPPSATIVVDHDRADRDPTGTARPARHQAGLEGATGGPGEQDRPLSRGSRPGRGPRSGSSRWPARRRSPSPSPTWSRWRPRTGTSRSAASRGGASAPTGEGSRSSTWSGEPAVTTPHGSRSSRCNPGALHPQHDRRASGLGGAARDPPQRRAPRHRPRLPPPPDRPQPARGPPDEVAEPDGDQLMRNYRIALCVAGGLLLAFGAFRLVTNLDPQTSSPWRCGSRCHRPARRGHRPADRRDRGAPHPGPGPRSSLPPGRADRGALITVIAIPLINRRGTQPAVKAILLRNYAGNLALLLGLTAAVALAMYAARVLRERGSTTSGTRRLGVEHAISRRSPARPQQQPRATLDS